MAESGAESTAMAVRGWIGGDESAKSMLARVFTERPFLLLPPLHRVPLRVGNVVELVGPSPSAKTHILMQATVNCVLPREWKGVHYGGLERLSVFVDLDCRFDVSRLAQMLRHRIVEAHRGDEELFDVCMRRFLYTRCYDSFEFLATLKTLHYRLRKEREAHGVSVHFLMIDSIGAFHWVDRASTSFPVAGKNRKRISLQVVFETVVQEIKRLLLVHHMLVITTKSTILGDRSSMQDPLPYREYMPSVWQELDEYVTNQKPVRFLPKENYFYILCYTQDTITSFRRLSHHQQASKPSDIFVTMVTAIAEFFRQIYSERRGCFSRFMKCIDDALDRAQLLVLFEG